MFDRNTAVTLTSHASQESEQAVAEAGQLAHLLDKHLKVGFWRMEVPSGELIWSRRAFEIYGRPYQPGVVDTALQLNALVPEDRPRAADILVRAIKAKTGFEYALRVARSDGGIRVVECHGEVDLNAGGAVRALFGTVRDVTDRAEADNIAGTRSNLLRSLLKHVPAAIAVFDRNMNYLAVSDHWLVGHGHLRADELIGKCHYDVRPDIAPAHKVEHQQVLAGNIVKSPRGYLKDRMGNTITQVCTMAPWLTAGGDVGGMILMLPTVDQSQIFKPVEPPEPADNDDLPTMTEFLSVLKSIA